MVLRSDINITGHSHSQNTLLRCDVCCWNGERTSLYPSCLLTYLLMFLMLFIYSFFLVFLFSDVNVLLCHVKSMFNAESKLKADWQTKLRYFVASKPKYICDFTKSYSIKKSILSIEWFTGTDRFDLDINVFVQSTYSDMLIADTWCGLKLEVITYIEYLAQVVGIDIDIRLCDICVKRSAYINIIAKNSSKLPHIKNN